MTTTTNTPENDLDNQFPTNAPTSFDLPNNGYEANTANSDNELDQDDDLADADDELDTDDELADAGEQSDTDDETADANEQLDEDYETNADDTEGGGNIDYGGGSETRN